MYRYSINVTFGYNRFDLFSYNYVAEKVSEATHAVTGDAHKEVAKDPNQSVGTRVGAAVDAAKDKVQEKTSEVKADAHKQNL